MKKIGFSVLLSLLLIQGQAFAEPNFKRVIMVVLENTKYKNALIQPFLAKLTEQGALLNNCHAEWHPSQPNYVAMIAGSRMGVWNDKTVDINGTHLGNLLNEKGISWKVYAEDYPGNCFLGKKAGKYVRRHVPFLNFKNVQSNPEECAKIVNAEEFNKDVSNDALPSFSLYVPNLDHDGHDTNVAVADRWMSQTFGDKFSNPEFMKDTLFVVTFDESNLLSLKNQIFTVFVGANVIPGSIVPERTSHYSILKTIEDGFQLGSLGRRDSTTPSVQHIWR